MTCEDLVGSFSSGCGLTVIAALLKRSPKESNVLAEQLALLHNRREIDLVGAFSDLRNSKTEAYNFFLVRNILEQALPNLDAEVTEVVKCVSRSLTEAGNDLAAASILKPFRAYLEKDELRPQKAIQFIGDNLQYAILLPAIVGSGSLFNPTLYITEAIRLSTSEDVEVRRQAVFSLGNIAWDDRHESLEATIQTLEAVSHNEPEDQVLASALKSSVTIAKRVTSKSTRCEQLIGTILRSESPYVLHAATEILAFNRDGLSDNLQDCLLSALTRVSPGSRGSIENIDLCIADLLNSGHLQRAIVFLEKYLVLTGGSVTMESFGAVSAALIRHPELMQKMTTRWFLSGDRTLCGAIAAIVGGRHVGKLELGVDEIELGAKDRESILYLARKAIGYLFFYPVSACSFIVSLLRSTTDTDTQRELCRLLLDPLLLNYTASARLYLTDQIKGESAEVADAITAVIAELDRYLREISSIPSVPELHPSEAHREAFHRKFSRDVTESYRKAEQQSVLLTFVSKVVVLYGRKSVVHAISKTTEPNRIEATLKSHSVEIEVPRYEIINSIGLDYILRLFRGERRP